MKSKLVLGLVTTILGGVVVAIVRSRALISERQTAEIPTERPPSLPDPPLSAAASLDPSQNARAPILEDSAKVEDPKGSVPGSSAGTQRRTSNRYGTFPFSVEQSRKWQAKYEGKTMAELDAARESIERAIDQVAHPILKEMLLKGQGTLMDKQQPITSKDNEVVSLMLAKGNGGGVYRAALSPDEYPDIYELRYESIWLTYAIGGRFRQAAAGWPSDR